jgi:hypothetical protein
MPCLPTNSAFRLSKCAALFALCCLPSLAQAGQTIAVGLASGRVFTGEIDSRTDNDILWLRAQLNGATILRPISWQRVLLARIGNEELTSEELQTRADSLKSKPTERAPTEESPADHLPPPPKPMVDRRQASEIQRAQSRDSQVRWISIDAQVANWNQTVETDGIVVHLFPLDDAGYMVPVDGTLDVELVAAVPYGSRLGVPFPVIGRWTVTVSPDQFGPAGAMFKLPFQSVHPDFDLNVGPLGLVNARLNVPGNGSFETSQSMVRIRPYSAVRDESQQIDGRRFFDVERVDRWGR